MKKLFRKILTIDEKITECHQAIEGAQKLPFYSIFKSERQREQDLRTLNLKLAGLLEQKVELLEKLENKIQTLKTQIL